MNMGNRPEGFSASRRLTWTSFFMWRQESKGLIVEAVELVKAQVQDIRDISPPTMENLLVKASHKVRPYSKGKERHSTT